ncbi:hypothetical protein JCM19039_3583 [Geomicrobium sp. JCM 19039]|nr:hypothetical protein JCM19039_3583 [Geomicrobium sp. JCM 19039]
MVVSYPIIEPSTWGELDHRKRLSRACSFAVFDEGDDIEELVESWSVNEDG